LYKIPGTQKTPARMQTAGIYAKRLGLPAPQIRSTVANYAFLPGAYVEDFAVNSNRLLIFEFG
jgi:hypothetical protein